MGQNSRKKLDVLMGILMIVVMSYQATGNLFHEVAGVILLVLFIIHNILNRKWYKNIPKGKYSGFRNMMLIINLFTLICMLAAMGTGIYLSQSVFAPLVGNERGIFNPAMACGRGSMGNDPGIFSWRHAYQDFREEKASVYDWPNPADSIRYLGVLCSGYAEPVTIAGYGNVLAVFGNLSVFGKCAYDGVFCGSGSDHGGPAEKKTQ